MFSRLVSPHLGRFLERTMAMTDMPAFNREGKLAMPEGTPGIEEMWALMGELSINSPTVSAIVDACCETSSWLSRWSLAAEICPWPGTARPAARFAAKARPAATPVLLPGSSAINRLDAPATLVRGCSVGPRYSSGPRWRRRGHI